MATYYSKLLSELLGKIPANANTVIEAGYTSGALSQAYKHINPNAQYIAIGVTLLCACCIVALVLPAAMRAEAVAQGEGEGDDEEKQALVSKDA